MNDLLRDLAPISAVAWKRIDDEARSSLRVALAARKLVDFVGPLGWEASSVPLGRMRVLEAAPFAGVRGALRQVQPLVELRADFRLARSELDALGRGAPDANLDAVRAAAQALARAEDRAVFHGYSAGGIVGVCEAAADEAVPLSPDYEEYPASLSKALSKLRMAGVDGPFAIALGPRCYAGLSQTTTRGGYPVLHHVQRLLDGPLVWAPAVDGAVVLSQRGGDFELTVGRDVSIGYAGHDADHVDLYLEESFTFRCLAPEAAIPLRYLP